MTGDRLAEVLLLLHWSQRGLAGILGAPETLVRRWLDGSRPIPGEVAAWLERLAGIMRTFPAPVLSEHRAAQAATLSALGREAKSGRRRVLALAADT